MSSNEDQIMQPMAEMESKKEEESDEFHAWQCFSLLRRYSTLDFQIKDELHAIAFFHVAWRAVYKVEDSEFMSVYRRLKFKMKLGYNCWKRGCEL